MERIKSVERAPSRIIAAKNSLINFSKEHNIPSLEDRIKRGLNLVAVLALPETDQKIHDIASKLGASYEDVAKMTVDIQLEGPWKYTSKLQEGTDPVIKTWMIMEAVTTMKKEQEMQLTEKEFVEDLDRIGQLLDEARKDPEEFYSKASQYVLAESQKKFRIEDGVPISENNTGFIAMAMNGYKSGVIQDADGILYVGAEKINDETLTNWGLKMEQKDDGRGRIATYYVNEKGESVVKKLFPGFAVIISRNFGLAKAIVKESASVLPEVIGQKVYSPTSMPKRWEGKPRLRPSARIPEPTLPENLEGAEKVRTTFYSRLAFLKTQEIFRDRSIVMIRKMREKGQGRITNDTLESNVTKTVDKVGQKMDELRYMTGIINQEFPTIPPEVDRIVDMAGGAGDLGLALSMEMMLRGQKLKETDIVDPVPELEVFNRLIVVELPDAEKFKAIVKYKVETLQEAEVPADAMVVAKHACGDLTDTIIEKWVNSDSPVLVLMTCCQDKAQDQPARYKISQEDWKKWCKDSAKTNGDNPKKVAEGMEAMTRLDEARVNYLRRYGFEAKLLQTDKFPKGDVIIARRITKKE